MGLLALAIFFYEGTQFGDCQVDTKKQDHEDVTIFGFSKDIFRRSRFVLSLHTYI